MDRTWLRRRAHARLTVVQLEDRLTPVSIYVAPAGAFVDLNGGALADGDAVSFSPGPNQTTTLTFGQTAFTSVESAIGDADVVAGSTIRVAPGTYVLGVAQVAVTRNLTLVGYGASQTIIQPGQSVPDPLGTDERAMFLVPQGVSFNVSSLAIDGTAPTGENPAVPIDVGDAIRYAYIGVSVPPATSCVDHVAFRNIRSDAMQPPFPDGIGVNALSGQIDVIASSFTNMGWMGASYETVNGPATNGTFGGNTYTGKGNGFTIDYAVEVNHATNVTVEGNVVTNNLATFSQTPFFFESAGVLVHHNSSFGEPAPTATIRNNTFQTNVNGVIVGLDSGDVSNVTIANNNFVGNAQGLDNSPRVAPYNAADNFWGNATGPTHTTNPGGTGDSAPDVAVVLPFSATAFPNTFATPAECIATVAGTIGGRVFEPDTNAPFPGVTVVLDLDSDGVQDPADVVTTTDANGNYAFTNLTVSAAAAGTTYRVFHVVEAGAIPLSPASADVTLTASAPNATLDFRDDRPGAPLPPPPPPPTGGTISGVKFNDLDGDGTLDPGEPGLGGFVIFIDGNGNGTFDANEVGTSTAADGTYTLAVSANGTFTVREVQQAGFNQTTPNPAPVAVSGGVAITGVNFGNRAVPLPPPPPPPLVRLFAVGKGFGGEPLVRLYNADGSLKFSFFAYDGSVTNGVRVATADVDGDGTEDVITAAGVGAGPHVKVFSGTNLALIHNFFAYPDGQTGGVYVAAGDVTGDGRADVITGAGFEDTPIVRVFDGLNLARIHDFLAYENFCGGVTVAAGDVTGDGRADIITGPGFGGTSHVKAFDGVSLALVHNFLAFGEEFLGGIYVGSGQFAGDARADIVVGAGFGGPPEVRVFDGGNGSPAKFFTAYDPTFGGGVRVAGLDVDGDGDGEVLTGAGFGGSPHVRAFDLATNNSVLNFFAFEEDFAGGVFVG